MKWNSETIVKMTHELRKFCYIWGTIAISVEMNIILNFKYVSFDDKTFKETVNLRWSIGEEIPILN